MLRAPESVVRPGEVVAGRYRVEALVGQGGFGAVFRAAQLPMGRLVALKIVLPQAAQNPEVRARFRREAELAQKLEHPNTVRLYDFGETEAGIPFIVWEYLKGVSLEDELKTRGALDPARVARIGAQTLKSLMEAHALGVVHRDIKPSNLFLCDFSGERDFVKVLDFGIAKVADGQSVTLGGTILGTPAYMSPEQVSGATVTAASDLYALGLVMAEALSGLPVYRGDSALSIAMGQLSDVPPPLPDVAVGSIIGPVIVRATQKSAALRYGSAAEMLAALEAIEPAWLRAADSRQPASSPSAPLPPTISAPPGSAPTVASAPPPAPSPGASSVSDERAGWSVVPPTFDDPSLAMVQRPTAEVPTSPSPGVAAGGIRRPTALIVVSAVFALAAAALGYARCSGGGPSPQPAASGRAHPDADATRGEKNFHPNHRLAAMTSRDVRARAERAGCHVFAETHTDSPQQNIYSVQCGADSGNILIAKYADVTYASAVEAAMSSRGNGVLREGAFVMTVSGLPNSKRIVDAFR